MSKQTLTKVPGSKMAIMFSGKIVLNKTRQGNVFIDRDPDTFKNLLIYLSNDMQDIEITDLHKQTLFILELKYWGIPVKKLHFLSENQKDFAEQIQTSVFDVKPKYVSENQLEKWKELGPLKIEDIVDNSGFEIETNIPMSLNDDRNINTWYRDGQLTKDRHWIQGYGRKSDRGFELYEGYFQNEEKDGYVRIIYQSGDVYQGFVKDL